MRSSTSRRDPNHGPHPDDPWLGRLAFHVLQAAAAWWVTLWLLLILAALLTLAVVGGPWMPGAIAAATGLVVSGTAIAEARAQAEARTPDSPPAPDLPPPP